MAINIVLLFPVHAGNRKEEVHEGKCVTKWLNYLMLFVLLSCGVIISDHYSKVYLISSIWCGSGLGGVNGQINNNVWISTFDQAPKAQTPTSACLDFMSFSQMTLKLWGNPITPAKQSVKLQAHLKDMWTLISLNTLLFNSDKTEIIVLCHEADWLHYYSGWGSFGLQPNREESRRNLWPRSVL